MSGQHLPSVVASLGQTEYPDAYGGLTARLTGPDDPLGNRYQDARSGRRGEQM